MNSALISVLNGFFVYILFLITTGGTILKFGKAKIEFSTVDLWGLVFALILGAAWKWDRARFLKSWPVLAYRWAMDPKNASRWMWRVCVFFFALIFFAHGVKHLSFETHLWDMVPVHQGLFNPWATSKTQAFACDACIGLSSLGEHLSFSFFLLAPLTGLFKSDTLIFLLQTAVLALPLYLAIREKLEAKYWLVALAILLSQRTLRNAGIWDFREDDLAYLGLFLMIIGFSRKNLFLLFSAMALALFSKENIFAVTLVFSVPVLLSKESGWDRRTRIQLAAAIALISLIYGWLAFKVWIPHFAGPAAGQHPVAGRLAGLGKSPSEILINFFIEPGRLFSVIGQMVFQAEALKYLVFLFAPVALFFRSKESWIWLVPASAGIAMNLLSSASTQRMLQFHYDLIIVPFLSWAALIGMKEASKAKKPLWVVGLLIALCFSGRWPGFTILNSWPSVDEVMAAHAFSRLEGDEPTASNATVTAHLTHLPRLTGMIEPFGDPAKPFWTKLMNMNPKTDPKRRGRSLREATRVVLDLNEDWEKDFFQELQNRKAKVELMIRNRWVVVRTSRPIGSM